LHGGQDLGAFGGYQQEVRRVGVDGNEGVQIRLQVRGGDYRAALQALTITFVRRGPPA